MYKIHTLCTWSTDAELGHHSDKNSTCQTSFNCNYPCCCNSTLLYAPYILMVTRISVTLITAIPYTSYKFTVHHMCRNKNKEQDITSMNLQSIPIASLDFFAPVTLYCQCCKDFTTSCATFQPCIIPLVCEWVGDSQFDLMVTSGLT